MSSFSNAESTIIQSLQELQLQMVHLSSKLNDLEQLSDLREDLSELRESVTAITQQKDFYSTREVAELMGVTTHTVQVRWCAEGRIECEKEAHTGRWKIPGHEFERLRRGGSVNGGC